MYECLSGAIYNSVMDVQRSKSKQDVNTGQFVATWDTVEKNVPCYANSIKTDAVSDDSSGKDFKLNNYDEFEFIKIKTRLPLTKRDRITNIRTSEGELIWADRERDLALPQVFQVQGIIVEKDPFGSIRQYKILAQRVKMQDA